MPSQALGTPATRTVLITGSSRGIGAATAVLCASQGWAVAVNYTRDAAAAQAVVQRIQLSGGTAQTFQADVADEAQVVALFEAVDAALPPLGALVNNAGVVDFASRVAELVPEVPLQRAGSADEVAQAIAWLLSDAASYMTASLIDVTGGR